jgi:hypothetical protein
MVFIINHIRPVKGQPSLYSFSAADMDARSVMEQRLQVHDVDGYNDDNDDDDVYPLYLFTYTCLFLQNFVCIHVLGDGLLFFHGAEGSSKAV